jgi:hypothetical protein
MFQFTVNINKNNKPYTLFTNIQHGKKNAENGSCLLRLETGQQICGLSFVLRVTKLQGICPSKLHASLCFEDQDGKKFLN